MKLTKEMRTATIDKCVKHTFKDADCDLLIARTELGDALYNHALGDAEKIAKKLPPNWCKTQRSVDINCEGFRKYFSKREDMPHPNLKLSKDRLLPQTIIDQFTVKEDHPLFDKAQEIIKTHEKIHAGKHVLESRLIELLYSVTTLDRLKAVWPEGEKFFPVEEKKVLLPVPHSLTLQINKMMALP